MIWMRLILVIVISILISLEFQVQAGPGDTYSRQLLQTTQSNAQEEGDDPCDRFSNPRNNEFYSPAYRPDDPTYPSDMNCVLVLEAEPGYMIRLDFRDYFEIEDSDGCKNDYLEIRDGPYGYNNVLGQQYCGLDNKYPPMITSSDRHLWIHFKSDENIEYKGFRAVYEFIPRPPTLKTPERIPCNINVSGPHEGILNKTNDIPSVILDFHRTYGAPIDCLWTIEVAEGMLIYLQFTKFSLDKPNDCDNNFVQVFSDKTEMASQDKIFCGSMAETVVSKSNKTFIRFYSTTNTKKIDVVANYTAYRSTKSGKCNENGFSNEFYCEDETCIDESLKCNKRFNCRSRFDEEGCETTSSQLWSGEHMISIMVVFSLILTGMCITFIYNCITKLIRDHQTIQVNQYTKKLEHIMTHGES